MGIDTRSIKSKSLATRLYLSLDYTSRKAFYKSLSADSKDAVYEMLTDQHIKRVPAEKKRAIDKVMNRARNKRVGYIVPDKCHSVENGCLWQSASWYFHNGDVDDGLLQNLPHMKSRFDALRQVYKEDWK